MTFWRRRTAQVHRRNLRRGHCRASADRTPRAPGEPGVRLCCYLDVRQLPALTGAYQPTIGAALVTATIMLSAPTAQALPSQLFPVRPIARNTLAFWPPGPVRPIVRNTLNLFPPDPVQPPGDGDGGGDITLNRPAPGGHRGRRRWPT
ncbi:DUF6207 family protein [Streptomyces sp. NPDC050546]|uniref:DUF6207 family protein n=1 Tax=Streptomyces sp. NPDC050546 TaxID=3365628 RepID=UPI0037BD79F2